MGRTPDQGDRRTAAAFEWALATILEVLEAHRLFGDPDYVRRALSADKGVYKQLYDDRLSAVPGLRRLTSTIVMKNVVDLRPLPE